MPRVTEGRRQGLFLLAVLCLLLTGGISALVRPFNPETTCCDHLMYRSMSYNLFSVTRPDLNVPPPGNPILTEPDLRGVARYGLNRWPPYVYRIVTPLLARGLAYATGIDVAYYLISFVALAAAAFFVGLSILELTRSLIPAIGGSVLFLVNPFSAAFNLWDYMLTDPIALFLAALAIWALVRRNRWLFFVACAIGVLNKESMVPMLVAYPLSEVWIEHHLRWSSIAAAAGIGIGWYVFRLAMPTVPTNYSMFNQFRAGMHHVVLMIAAGTGIFGVVIPAVLRRPWGSKLMISLVPFAVAAVLSAWLVDNLERAMVQALPAVCVAILWKWPVERRQQILTLLVVPLAGISEVVWATRHQVALRALQNMTMPRYLTVSSLLCLYLIAVAAEVWLYRLQADSSAHVEAMQVEREGAP